MHNRIPPPITIEQQFNNDKITRFEVIDNNGRVYVSKGVSIRQSITTTNNTETIIISSQPVEETTNDWIDEAYKYFIDAQKKLGDTNPTEWIGYMEEVVFREAIEKHMPKQELIPLDVENCFIEIRDRLMNTGLKLDNTKEIFIKEILSKYGYSK